MQDERPDKQPIPRLHIDRLALFAELPDGARQDLAVSARIERHAAGKRLVEQGEAGEEMYFILSGRVGVDREGEGGGVVRLKELGPDEYFGEMAVTGSGERLASVSVLQDALLLVIPGDAVLAAARRHRGVLLELIRLQSRRIGEIAETLLSSDE